MHTCVLLGQWANGAYLRRVEEVQDVLCQFAQCRVGEESLVLHMDSQKIDNLHNHTHLS